MKLNIGDRIGTAKGDNAVVIEITALDPVAATVVVLGSFYSGDRLKDGFLLGEELTFQEGGCDPITYTIYHPIGRPWFSIYEYKGIIYFEHYR